MKTAWSSLRCLRDTRSFRALYKVSSWKIPFVIERDSNRDGDWVLPRKKSGERHAVLGIHNVEGARGCWECALVEDPIIVAKHNYQNADCRLLDRNEVASMTCADATEGKNA